MIVESYTQAYHAGIICAMAHNHFPDEELPSFIQCCTQPYAMRELFKERMWQKMKSRSAFRRHIASYEKLVFQPKTPLCLKGTAEDFALGFIRSYEHSQRKHDLDKLRIEALAIA